MGQISLQQKLKLMDQYNFKHPQLLQILQHKQQINFSSIKNYCIKIGQGYCAEVFLYKELNIVLKIMKKLGKNAYESIIKQVIILQKISSIWPGIFQYLVFDNNALIGFSMKYFQGKKIWEAYMDPGNIYYQNPSSRIRLVKKLKDFVKKLQEIKVCHGDLHIDNIMIKQKDPSKQDCQLLIIDYGLAFIIDDFTLQKPGLTGWTFIKPYQSKTGNPFNTNGLNAYMFGRVALQILLLQNYEDYSYTRLECPNQQLKQLSQFGYDKSVEKQIQKYLDPLIQVRNKALFQPSQMKQQVKDIHINQQHLKKRNYGSLTDKIIQKLTYTKDGKRYDQSYYQLHPQKLGYN